MPCHIAAIIVFAAISTAQSGTCQDTACDVEEHTADTITLLQAPGAAEGVIKAHGEASDKKSLLQTLIESSEPVSMTAGFAEFVAMTLFVVIGCGSAMGSANEPGWVLQVALSFGLAISALAYSIGHYSGGQINCAVTFALALTGQISVCQGLVNFSAQLLGAITGALILTAMCPEDKDKTGGLGTNAAPEGRKINAFVGEVMMTFLLVFVIFETAINPESKANREIAALAIGFAVFLAHSVLIPLDGCSINPTRSLGPALVRKFCYKDAGSFEDMWIFWTGPLLGAAGAAAVSTMLM